MAGFCASSLKGVFLMLLPLSDIHLPRRLMRLIEPEAFNVSCQLPCLTLPLEDGDNLFLRCYCICESACLGIRGSQGIQEISIGVQFHSLLRKPHGLGRV